MCKFIGKSDERILFELDKSGILRLYSIVHVAMETTNRQILPVDQKLPSVYDSLAKFQLVSCNLSLAMIWQNDIYSETAKTVFGHLTMVMQIIWAYYSTSPWTVSILTGFHRTAKLVLE